MLYRAIVHLGKFENILDHHTNAIKYLMESCLAHKGTAGDNLIFLIHMSFIDILADVFTAQLGDGFGSPWYIRRSEKSDKSRSSLVICMMFAFHFFSY